MRVILSFLIENWMFCLEIFILLASLFVGLFRKKVKVESDVLSRIIRCLPFLIVSAERSFTESKSGITKKAKVMDLALSLYKDITGQELTYDSYIAKQIDLAIEDILSTPQKKGETDA